MIKAIFFDVDDTMYDHLFPFKRAVESVVTHTSNFPFEEAYHRMRYYSDKLSVEYGGAEKMASLGIEQKMQAERFLYTLADFNIKVTMERAEQIQQDYLATQFNISLFPNMDSLIKMLQAKGLKVGLLTNGAEQHQSKKIKALKLDELVDADKIYISGAYGIDKPNPAIFKHITNAHQLQANECLYVGDSWRNDVIGATNAGWKVLWFNHRRLEMPYTHPQIEQVNDMPQLMQYFESFRETIGQL